MLVCYKCGSKNVQSPAWVDANTNEYISDYGSDGKDHWCNDCQSEVSLTEALEACLLETVSIPEIRVYLDKKVEPGYQIDRNWRINSHPAKAGASYLYTCEYIGTDLRSGTILKLIKTQDTDSNL